MPSIAQQLRVDRHRRARRRRTTLTVLAAALAAVVGTRFLADVSAEALDAGVVDRASTIATTPPAPTTTSVATGLHPGLVDAFEAARSEAADAGHRLTITSGFRTAAEQQALLDDEIAERGSRSEALWWVFPPETSMHVQGLAIDVGDGQAADWLVDHGARFGLCRTLDWEWWHFEWRERWEADAACPAPARTPEGAPRP